MSAPAKVSVVCAPLAMQPLLVSLIVLAAVISSEAAFDTEVRGARSVSVSSPRLTGNASYEESSFELSSEHLLQNKLHGGSMTYAKVLQVDNKVLTCIQSIAEKGYENSFQECKDVVDEADKYCREELRKASGGRAEKETVPCREMLAALETVAGACELFKGSGQNRKRAKGSGQNRKRAAKGSRQKRNRDDEVCDSLPTEPCRAGELHAQVPGSFLEEECIPVIHESNTQELPIRLFQSKSSMPPGALVEVHTIPIGQGDCNIIVCNGGRNVILFDCGSSQGNPFNDDKRKYGLLHSPFDGAESVTVIISHNHIDHHNMVMKVLNKQFVSLPSKNKVRAILGGREGDYKAQLVNKVEEVAEKVEYVTEKKREYFCEDTSILFDLLPGNQSSSNTNERGIVMKLHFNNTCKSSLLFTADMEGPTAKEMAAKHRDVLRSTHYKLAHHGAADKANEKEWLEAIMPIEVHISHVYGGRYRHPRCEALDRLIQCCNIGVASGTPGAKEHDLTCFKEKYKVDKCVYHRVFSTAPRVDKICLITLSFFESKEPITGYYCGAPDLFFE